MLSQENYVIILYLRRYVALFPSNLNLALAGQQSPADAEGQPAPAEEKREESLLRESRCQSRVSESPLWKRRLKRLRWAHSAPAPLWKPPTRRTPADVTLSHVSVFYLATGERHSAELSPPSLPIHTHSHSSDRCRRAWEVGPVAGLSRQSLLADTLAHCDAAACSALSAEGIPGAPIAGLGIQVILLVRLCASAPGSRRNALPVCPLAGHSSE